MNSMYCGPLVADLALAIVFKLLATRSRTLLEWSFRRCSSLVWTICGRFRHGYHFRSLVRLAGKADLGLAIVFKLLATRSRTLLECSFRRCSSPVWTICGRFRHGGHSQRSGPSFAWLETQVGPYNRRSAPTTVRRSLLKHFGGSQTFWTVI